MAGKKDFDKDKMYQKIMPSIVPEAAEDDTPQMDEHPPAPLEAGELRLHNYMENMVLDKLEHTMRVLEACPCERCRMDITALALNQLPPSYAVASPGDTQYIKKLRGAFEVKVTASLIRAVQQVKNSPRH